MSSLSARRIEVVGTPGLNALYYGYSTIVDVPMTRLAREGQEFYDEMLMTYPDRNPEDVLTTIDAAKNFGWARTAVVGPSATRLAASVVADFSQGKDASIVPKTVFSDLITFSEHVVADYRHARTDIYPQLTSPQMKEVIDRAGLGEEMEEVFAEDGMEAFYTDRISYPAHWRDVFDHRHGYNRSGHELDNMEGRRQVAAAYGVQMFGLATGALYAACVNNGDQNAGLVADLLDPLLRT